MPKQKQRTKKERIEIRLSTEEKNNLLYKMKLAKIESISSLIRKLLNTGFVININTNGLLDLIYEINKIGININQIAKIANETHNIYENDIKEINKKVNYIKSNLNFLMNQIDKINGR